MAEYYTQFSFEIRGLNDDEEAWCNKLELFLGQDPEVWDFVNPDADVEFAGIVEPGSWPSVAVSTQMGDDGHQRLWVWSGEDGCGSPDEAATIARKFLDRFRPDETIAFEFAVSCSKPRLDSFGGGAVVITAENTEWLNTGTWIYEMTRVTEPPPDSEH